MARVLLQIKDIVCLTDSRIELSNSAKMVFDMPGAYEINEIFITGLAVEGQQQAQLTAYKVFAEGLNYAIVGHLKAGLSDEQLEVLDAIDVLFVPIGGSSTLDVTGALSLVKSLDPCLVIPTAYRQRHLKFTHDWVEVEEFVKKLALEPEWLKPGWRLKKNDLSDQLSLKIFKD